MAETAFDFSDHPVRQPGHGPRDHVVRARAGHGHLRRVRLHQHRRLHRVGFIVQRLFKERESVFVTIWVIQQELI